MILSACRTIRHRDWKHETDVIAPSPPGRHGEPSAGDGSSGHGLFRGSVNSHAPHPGARGNTHPTCQLQLPERRLQRWRTSWLGLGLGRRLGGKLQFMQWWWSVWLRLPSWIGFRAGLGQTSGNLAARPHVEHVPLLLESSAGWSAAGRSARWNAIPHGLPAHRYDSDGLLLSIRAALGLSPRDAAARSRSELAAGNELGLRSRVGREWLGSPSVCPGDRARGEWASRTRARSTGAGCGSAPSSRTTGQRARTGSHVLPESSPAISAHSDRQLNSHQPDSHSGRRAVCH